MSIEERFDGKSIPTSEFTDDDGRADPAVVQALVDFHSGVGTRSQAANAIASGRLFVPVKAVLDSTETTDDGHRVEKDSHMATVSVQIPDGRRGLLAFTSVAAMSSWDVDARPVAARAQMVAAAAIDEGADALIIDSGSDHMFVVDSALLESISAGETVGSVITDPQIQAAVMDAVAGLVQRYSCQFELSEPRGEADIRLTLLAPASLDTPAVMQEVAAALSGSDVLRSRLSRGVELGSRPAGD